ncbi:vWA domain-containing protein [Gulbenkiania mobilis]|uniref:vWA domain-containing protein n=1 Tax=Gulbenkiania mobilis TaxID=397457 RepID=UPI0006BBB5F9|nr:VWA domain-containing protein [Gulbenkiania mobilis]
MLIDFFTALRAAGLPVSLKEFLTLLSALQQRVVFGSVDDFYVVSRAVLVKDEKYYDRFDQVFGQCFAGLTASLEDLKTAIPEDWLRRQVEKYLTDEEKAALQARGWHDLMDTLRKRLETQHARHQGGNKWIGTGGTSPFGAWGYNPAGIRIGQDVSRHRRAVKVWDRREFRNFDDTVELGTRNIKLALRRLRAFAREGAPDVLDLEGTIAATARRAGFLDLQMVPALHNTAKLLVLFDVGGSMDDHVRACEELFSAVKSEFKHLEYYYFHNCVYERVWKDNARRHGEGVSTWDLIHTFGSDYRLIFVGDATMSPYEIVYPGGSVEHMNEEAGEVWMRRLLGHFHRAVWLNPQPERFWSYTQSLTMMRDLMQGRMYPLTLHGLEDAIRTLQRKTPLPA